MTACYVRLVASLAALLAAVTLLLNSTFATQDPTILGVGVMVLLVAWWAAFIPPLGQLLLHLQAKGRSIR